VEKHTEYYEVMEALRDSKSCAICGILEGNSKRHLEGLMYESVNDPTVRAPLVKSHGFCRKHTLRLLDCGDPLGLAILYQDQLSCLKRELDALERRPSVATRALEALGAGRAPREWKREDECPECKAEREWEARNVSVLAGWIGDPELMGAIEKGVGLCAQHLLMTAQACQSQEKRKMLIEAHRAKIDALLSELAEFVRKSEYRALAESFGKESDSWMRAVKEIASLA